MIDKVNGGKADSLNCGLNLARYRYVCGVDADTVLARDALLDGDALVLADPARVVGVTGHIAIARDPSRRCADGVHCAARHAAAASRSSTLDYLRAFFNNRTRRGRGST